MKKRRKINPFVIPIILITGFHVLLYGCEQEMQHQDLENETATHQSENSKPDPFSRHIPEGYYLVDSSSGDLNRDSFPDLLMILEKEEEENADDQKKRPLLILIGSNNGSYELKAENDQVVLCSTCGGSLGDPYQGISIKNGYFSLEHFGGSSWRWSRIITFKYSRDEDNWFLHRDGGENFHISDPENIEPYMRTKDDFGSVSFLDFSAYEE